MADGLLSTSELKKKKIITAQRKEETPSLVQVMVQYSEGSIFLKKSGQGIAP